jgi:hypothetical protein
VIVASAGAAVDLEPLTDDHRALQDVMTRANAALDAFAGGDDTAAARLGTVFVVVAGLLDDRIADEEATVSRHPSLRLGEGLRAL